MLVQQDITLSAHPWKKQVTRYYWSGTETRARIFYFHGGGLLYGSRKDLPEGHLRLFTQAGYEILSFDYPLAPAADLELILEDVCASIHAALLLPEPAPGLQESASAHSLRDTSSRGEAGGLPYFLWGRSAGAYLCLLAASGGRLHKKPAGLLSYYGYGFLLDDWFCTPSSHYRKLPPVDASCLQHIPQEIHTEGGLDRHYSVYVHARQTGCWKQLIYKGRDKFFYLDYSLRACGQLSCPLFAAHSSGDPDVPYGEFLELCRRYHPDRFIASGTVHDFDRNPDDPFTAPLLEASLRFMEKHQPIYREPGHTDVRNEGSGTL